MIRIACSLVKTHEEAPLIDKIVKVCNQIDFEKVGNALPCEFLPRIDEQTVYFDSDISNVQVNHEKQAPLKRRKKFTYKEYLQNTLNHKLFSAYRAGYLGIFYSEEDLSHSSVLMSFQKRGQTGSMLTMKRCLEEEIDSELLDADSRGHLIQILNEKKEILNIMINIQNLQVEIKQIMVDAVTTAERVQNDDLSGLYKKLEYAISVLARVFWQDILKPWEHSKMKKFLEHNGESSVTEWHLLQCHVFVGHHS